MARPGADVVGLIGSGFQARTQAEAMAAVRPVREIRIWSRSEEKRRAFAAELSASLPVRVMAARSAEEAIRGAGIVVTATSSRDPVVEAGWVEPGAHVNAVGSNQPNRRELPASLVRAAGLIAVDSLEQARMESGDLLLGLEDWSRVVELKDLVGGVHRKAEDITIFKSNGLAIEDVIAAGSVYERGLSEGAGQSLPVFQDYS
jgi:ornithine cyclodeaminase/alanine dehydrogenase-like protein (mu-crystallin family)